MTADVELMAETRRPPGAGGLRSSDCARPLLIPPAALRLVLVLVMGEEELGVCEIAHHLQAIDGVVVVLDAVVETGRRAGQSLLHPDGVLGHDDRLPGRAPDLRGVWCDG